MKERKIPSFCYERDRPDCYGCKYNLVYDSVDGVCIMAMDKETREILLMFLADGDSGKGIWTDR